jgi:hypothetical protein
LWWDVGKAALMARYAPRGWNVSASNRLRIVDGLAMQIQTMCPSCLRYWAGQAKAAAAVEGNITIGIDLAALRNISRPGRVHSPTLADASVSTRSMGKIVSMWRGDMATATTSPLG